MAKHAKDETAKHVREEHPADRFGTRRIIAIMSMAVLAFIAVFSVITGRDIPNQSFVIITALVGIISTYFAKSSVIEGVQNGVDAKSGKTPPDDG